MHAHSDQQNVKNQGRECARQSGGAKNWLETAEERENKRKTESKAGREHIKRVCEGGAAKYCEITDITCSGHGRCI